MRRPNRASVWHVCGTTRVCGLVLAVVPMGNLGCDLGLHIGAGEGNRTLMTSLEGCDCTPPDLRFRRSSP
jgi:hypothetical protein